MTIPLTGYDGEDGLGVFLMNDISIHIPLTGYDSIQRTTVCSGKISIHIPLTGYDSPSSYGGTGVVIFQSTYPSRGMTWFPSDHVSDLVISIHIPLTGYDTGTASTPRMDEIFQSTYPSRGMTSCRGSPLRKDG